ncbi:aspartate/glutamate racemase family protein [Desulforhopalus singaporensis]|uniref:Aspartate racemase n=1 Tax=Desulforhopalus singaporensis TaxID=91360 RepID=A0A1H0L1V5_9BACT|nr:aspartate/glutamate racemase family protein [Desulforhopalus singaporensis]SDO62199.1 aspartate racemase [Desulforhopalus singaporensis]
MKTIGMIGGMSWESTALYYTHVNEQIQRTLGGYHSARLILVNVDFQPFVDLMREGDWQEIEAQLAGAARTIERSGGDCLLICTNTMHKVADGVQAAVDIPLLHIADAAGAEIIRHGFRTVGLLGTRFTMEEKFYIDRLAQNFGLQVIVPSAEDRNVVDRVIFEELCHGRIVNESRTRYLRIIGELQAGGAEAIIAGCTEIGMLVGKSCLPVPLFDTTLLHAKQAVDFALS